MSYFRRVELNNRPKKFFDNANMTKQYLFVQTSTGGGGTTGGGGAGEDEEGETFQYHVEFDWETNIQHSEDFNGSMMQAIEDLGYSSVAIKTVTGYAYETGFIELPEATTISVSNALSSDHNLFDTTNDNILLFKQDVADGKLSITFTDVFGNTVVAEAKLTLETDLYHTNVYRFGQLYDFGDENVIKLISANATTAKDRSSRTINNGAKVWIQDRHDNYLIAEMEREGGSPTGKILGYKDGTIRWSSETQYRILFEVHAYNNPAMTVYDDGTDRGIIDSDRPIPNDYGFKLEILPPHISSVFTGLSDFVDGYEFELDGSYTLADNDADAFNISQFYIEEQGTDSFTNDPGISDGIYGIDECFLTFDHTTGTDYAYSFTFENDEPNSKKFWDGTEST